MPSAFPLNIKKGVIKKLRELGPKLERKYLNKAMHKGSAIVIAAAQARAKRFDDPSTAKQVWKEIAVYTSSKLGKENGGVALQIGVKGGAVKYKNTKENRRRKRVGKTYSGPGNVYYWRFLEFGTSKMAAQPFMRPALADNVGPVTDAITSSLNDGITTLASGPN